MKKILHIIVKFCIAVVLMTSVLAGYWPEPKCIIELTCISNFLLGVIFLLSGIRLLRGKKDYPNIVYSTGSVTLLLVFLVCMGSLSGINLFIN